MKTIEIAPSRKNTRIRGNKIIGRLSDGSLTYVLEFPKGSTIDPAERKTIKDAFRTVIALSSKPWQAEELLSKVFAVECHIRVIDNTTK